MKNSILFLVTFSFLLITCGMPFTTFAKETRWWEIQSVDTVKYSRDLSREKAQDNDFLEIIDRQVKDIAKTGATHIAIGTPYDEEFLPMLKKWVSAARKNNLKIWFRGNFSGWEQWFDYSKITRNEHLQLTKDFIFDNRDLFEEGDIFTPCPECENGGPGDPRKIDDIKGHRAFLIEEHQITSDAFRKIGKSVKSNFSSMNGDVAKEIYDEETTKALGGIVAIDHYVNSAEQLVRDIKYLANESNGKVVLGEFGAPIPDIHGTMTEQEQKDWLEKTLKTLVEVPELVGINYWVNVGGHTALWGEDGGKRQAVDTLSYYYQPKSLKGKIVNELGNPVELAKVSLSIKEAYSDKSGYFEIPYYDENSNVTVVSAGYTNYENNVSELKSGQEIILLKNDPGVIFRILRFFHKISS
ncbi:hypothetical protein ACFL0C_00745 [Patescibacteria group bacterium]